MLYSYLHPYNHDDAGTWFEADWFDRSNISSRASFFFLNPDQIDFLLVRVWYVNFLFWRGEGERDLKKHGCYTEALAGCEGHFIVLLVRLATNLSTRRKLSAEKQGEGN